MTDAAAQHPWASTPRTRNLEPGAVAHRPLSTKRRKVTVKQANEPRTAYTPALWTGRLRSKVLHRIPRRHWNSMVVGTKLARQEQDSASRSGSPARGTDSSSTDLDTDLGIGVGMGIGMFQPQPTAYLPFSLYPDGLHVANAGIPQYTFASTPLFEHFGGGHVGGSSAGNDDAGVVGGRSGPSPAGTFPAATNSNFHGSASASGGPAGMGAGVQPVQGLGPPSTVAAGDSSSAATAAAALAASILASTTFRCPYPYPATISASNDNPDSKTNRSSNSNTNVNIDTCHSVLTSPTVLPSTTKWSSHWSLTRTRSPSRKLLRESSSLSSSRGRLFGPLVGEKVSSQTITEEFARADPVYVAKTMALPQTYSHYRPMQGDGNCGWRVQSELHRMTGLSKYVEEVTGGEPSILELMTEETLLLFNDIITDMSERNDPMPNVFAKFNDPQTSNCFVYHLRLLASARLKGNSAQYQPYLDDTVENYITKTVMPVNREIDHICVVAVHDILLRPTNMVLDIAYLDRSEGTEVNVHRLPEEANGQDPSTLGPIIYLLYRPDHYDVLYRDTQVHIPPVPAVPAPVELQINRFVPPTQDFEEPVAAMQDTSYTMDMSALAMIPGLSSSTLSPPPMTDPYASSPASSWVSHFTPDVISTQPSPPQQQATVHPLRFSKYNFPNLHEMAAETNNAHDPPPTTNTFKNSHFNTAHYNNLNFQPEMYQPDAEEEAPSNGHSKNGGRKRSTEHCPGIKKEK
ncbi:hypothetical protein CHU98_g2305 [Xylaria longipes]|nr:hypothetical protein CHU98_g2305 [Xylaria longipes]